MMESGEFATIKELAEHEKLGVSYLRRLLRLCLLALESVEEILEGQQSSGMKWPGFWSRFRWFRKSKLDNPLDLKTLDAVVLVANEQSRGQELFRRSFDDGTLPG